MLLTLIAREGEDAARLDYIERHARRDPKMDGQHVWCPTSFNHRLIGPSLREAIDKAMQGMGGETATTAAGASEQMNPRSCETRKHVHGGLLINGRRVTKQRCAAYRAGRYRLLAATAVANPKKCGPSRLTWEPSQATHDAAVPPAVRPVAGSEQAPVQEAVLRSAGDAT
ncbi:MAG: hypothetical protein HC793_03955 [Aquincola sp.]|nr:hypothetical protein [Aquincola sp.]